MLVIIQAFSVIIIFSSYGIINHYNTKIDEVEGGSLMFELYMPLELYKQNGRPVRPLYTYEEVSSFFDEILPRIERKVDYIYAYGYTSDPQLMLETSAGYKKGRYTASRYFKKLFSQYDMESFTDEEYKNHEKVVFITSAMEKTDTILLGNTEYKVVGVLPMKEFEAVFIPYTSYPEEIGLHLIKVFLKSPLTRTEYDFLKETGEKYFGERGEVSEFDGIENESDYRVYRNMIFIIIGMVVICGINYCIIYQYLIYRNRNAFAICRICGCTRGRAAFGYITELLVESAAMFVLGAFVFYKWILNIVDEYFEYAVFYYNRQIDIYIFAVYMGVLFIIYSVQIYNYVRKTPSKLIKEV